MSVVMPFVHVNGTAASDLLDQRFAAVDALNAAGDALAKAAPNNRDYYLGGPKHCGAAHEQHDRRIAVLKGLIAELYEEITHIQDNSTP